MQTDLDAIEAAIARGVRQVRFSDGKQVVYPSIQDLLIARDTIKQALDNALVTTPKAKQVRMVSKSKGFIG